MICTLKTIFIAYCPSYDLDTEHFILLRDVNTLWHIISVVIFWFWRGLFVLWPIGQNYKKLQLKTSSEVLAIPDVLSILRLNPWIVLFFFKLWHIIMDLHYDEIWLNSDIRTPWDIIKIYLCISNYWRSSLHTVDEYILKLSGRRMSHAEFNFSSSYKVRLIVDLC